MIPEEFLRSLKCGEPSPVYLFLGSEAWARERCRRALIERVLPAEDREEGFTRHDLSELDLTAVIDAARSLSLFVRNRLLWVGSAETALPRGRGASEDSEEGGNKSDLAAQLEEYLRNPVPGVVLVFDCSRYGFEGEDKARLQRVQKFYSLISAQVEFLPYTPVAARKLAQELAREKKLKIASSELDLLVDVLGADASRIATELEKLSLYSGVDRTVTAADIWQLVPSAKASTIFTLVSALGRNDRSAALESLDVLVREGEYLPLALSFLGTQFRLALAAKEAKLTNANQVQAHLSKQGAPMWRARAEQVVETAGAFPEKRLRAAVQRIYETDKALRDTRPDDRTVVEQLVFGLTASGR
ncbi:MAG: DNA polymerase III subunit delta [Bryobacteraceae bacterium]